MCALFSLGKPTASVWRGFILFFCCLAGVSQAQFTDRTLSVQGRVTTNGVAFTGTGQFKFALIDGFNGPLLWTHDGSSNAGDFQPTTALSLPLTNGLYTIQLGDRNIPGMQAIDPAIFVHPDIRVRIWFNDGVNGVQRLNPDQRLSAVGFAFNADRAREAAVLAGNVNISQVPATLVTNGASNVNFTGTFTGDGAGLVGIRGSTPFQVVTVLTNDIVPNTGYLVTNTLTTTLLLPTNTILRVGDIVRVSGPNAGSWKITQHPGQSIQSGGFFGDIGAQWTAHESPRLWTDIASSADGQILVAGVAGGTGANALYVSTNFGVNWYVPNPTVIPLRNWRTLAGSADGSRWVAGTDAGTLFVSSDGGQIWETKGPPARNWTGVTASANGSNMVAVATGSQPFTSNDAGMTWTNRFSTKSWSALCSSSDGMHVYGGATTDRIYVSRDRGTNWGVLPPTVRDWTGIACSADGQRLIAVANNQALLTSSDYGTNWVTRTALGNRAWTSVCSSADGLKLGATYNGGIFLSIDGGENWNFKGPTGNVRAITSSENGRKLAVAISSGLIYTSVDEILKSTTVGVNGYLLGDEFSAIELQYIGNGKFFPLSSSGIIYAN